MTAEQFLELAAKLPEAMLLVHGDGAVLAANEAACRCFGDAASSLLGKSLDQLVADSPEKVQQSLRLWSRSRELVATGLTIVCGDKRLLCRCEGFLLRPRSGPEPATLLVRLIPREHSSQQFVLLNRRLQELSEEIHRRRKLEDEIRAQREWLQVTLTSIGDGVVVADAEGRVSLMNPEAERLTGWKTEEAKGRALEEVFQIVNEETRRAVDNPVAKVLREGFTVGLANHTVLISRNGDERPIDDSAAPIRNGEGQLQGVVLVFHDVSERRRLERELRQRAAELEEADRRKDEFLAMLAHELRNPLAPIRNAAELLRIRGSEQETVERAREIIDRQSRHLTALVDDLLDVSRITRGKIALKLEPVDLGRVVQTSVRDFASRCEEHRVALEVSAPELPLWVEGDRTRLSQVVDNLIDNACKFSERGDRVFVRLEADTVKNQAVLTVRDTGIGLDSEILPRLFLPFAQADRTLDRSRGGLGLGLSLVKGLVELHKGEIAVASEGLGRGTEFKVRLPLLSAPAALTERAGVVPPTDKSLRILIVEDNSDAADSLAMLIRLFGHEVLLARTGDEGLEVAIAQQPDIVLCDIGLPGKNGLEVAKILRSRPEFDRTRLIALTGYGQEDDKARAREAGFDSYLTKPAELKRLLDELKLGAR